MNRPSAPSCLVFFLVAAICLLTAPAFAQISNSCDGSENLGSTDSFPQNLNLPAPLGNNLNMTGAGCDEQGVEAVTCFVPENDCSISVTCNYTPGSTTMAVNLYTGACSASPAACAGSNTGVSPISLLNQALTSGTQYCVVCESVANVTSIALDIIESAGSCGSLPVGLLSFSVDDAGHDARPPRENL